MSIKIGDRVVVYRYGQDFPITVKTIEQVASGDTKITLDWGSHGESRVWLHDEGKTWHSFVKVN